MGSILLAQVGPVQAQDGAATAEVAPDASRDAEARGLFEAGRAAFADGRFDDALRYFQQSYELSHRPELLYNIGSAADRLQRESEALAAFQQYLRELPEAANRREVEGRVRVLQEHMAREQVQRDAAAEAQRAAARDAAASAPVVDPLADTGEPASGGGVETEWWFWTLIVAGVAGAGVLTGVLVATSEQTSYPPYSPADAVAFTLTVSVPTP